MRDWLNKLVFPKRQTEEIAFTTPADVPPPFVDDPEIEELKAEIARLKGIIENFEQAHTDDQVTINVMDRELTAIKETLEDSRNSYLENYEQNQRYERFYESINELRGKGLEVANWKISNKLTPIDIYLDAAETAMEVLETE